MNRLKVLFFSLWYPHRYDAMDGLFVRKHAQAVARFADVEVLFLYADARIREFEITDVTIDGVREVTVYFPKNGPLSYVNYFRAFSKGIKLMQTPDITQTNVIGKDGLCSWWLKKTKGIPYIAIEHWTGYLPQNFSYRGFFRKRIAETVARNASMIMPVSRALEREMKRNGLDLAPYEIVNNVVDDFFYDREEKAERSRIRILSVTCFGDSSKNLSGTLRVMRRIAQKRTDFEFVMIGTGGDYDKIHAYYESLDFPDGMVKFTGEQTPLEVAKWMKQSDILVIFSNFETFSVVAAEAYAVGLPIVASRSGGILDDISEGEGILVEPRNEEQLELALSTMLDSFAAYDVEAIREAGRQYSFDAVGRHLVDVYERALSGES